MIPARHLPLFGTGSLLKRTKAPAAAPGIRRSPSCSLRRLRAECSRVSPLLVPLPAHLTPPKYLGGGWSCPPGLELSRGTPTSPFERKEVLVALSSSAFYNWPAHTRGTLVKGETVRAAGARLRVTGGRARCWSQDLSEGGLSEPPPSFPQPPVDTPRGKGLERGAHELPAQALPGGAGREGPGESQ